MSKIVSCVELTSTLTLTECRDGFWLYDETRGMNLSMRAKTAQEAFIECISYYQNRLSEVEKKYHKLADKVESFVDQFRESDE